jgi:ribosomal protein L9
MPENIFSFSDILSQFFVHSIFRYCEAFPAIKGAIQRVKREKDRVKQKIDDKKSSKASSKSDLESKMKSDVMSSAGTSSKSFTLQRRLSTATPVRYDM